MKRIGFWMTAVCAANVLCLATVAMAQAPATPIVPIKGESVVTSTTVTATVEKIDQKTREVTLKTKEGKEYSFVASDAVKNLAQVKQGDIVIVMYTEALAYEVTKGGKPASAQTTNRTAGAQPGAQPGASFTKLTTMTVTITAIDRSVPSVTFKGPAGNTRTIKVKDPAKLEGVKVGDMVDISFAEALAIKVEKPPAK